MPDKKVRDKLFGCIAVTILGFFICCGGPMSFFNDAPKRPVVQVRNAQNPDVAAQPAQEKPDPIAPPAIVKGGGGGGKRRWCVGGTLHHAGALDWQTAAHEDKL